MNIANSLRNYSAKAEGAASPRLEEAAKEAGEKAAAGPRGAGPAFKVEIGGREPQGE